MTATTFVVGRTYLSGYSHESRWTLESRTARFGTFSCNGDVERRAITVDPVDLVEMAGVCHSGVVADRLAP